LLYKYNNKIEYILYTNFPATDYIVNNKSLFIENQLIEC
jgi:hypothetical protein